VELQATCIKLNGTPHASGPIDITSKNQEVVGFVNWDGNLTPVTFDDSLLALYRGFEDALESVTICAGDVVRGIRATTERLALPHHGGLTGEPNTIKLAPGERISEVQVWTGKWKACSCVLQLSLITTENRNLHYGNKDNGVAPVEAVYRAPAGKSARGFCGSTVAANDPNEGRIVLADLYPIFAFDRSPGGS
jgi:hypothetical protein